jgi:magnesium-transporting ATPase (P-type)
MILASSHTNLWEEIALNCSTLLLRCFLLVIVISTLFYGVVDYKTSKAMTAVKQLVAEKAWVTRNGAKAQIDAVQLLVGTWYTSRSEREFPLTFTSLMLRLTYI